MTAHVALPDLIRLDGRAAAVTGAGHGIGRGIALRLAEAGAAVAVADRDEASASAVADEIRAAGGGPQAIRMDVSDEAEVAALVVACREALGETTW